MNEKKRIIILAILILFINLNLVSAGFNKGNETYSLQKTYVPNETIKGWINISINNEDFNSKLTAFDSEIILREFLTKNNLAVGVGYNCTIHDCGMHYKTLDNGTETKSLSLNSGQTALIGLKITDPILDVNNFKISFTTNAADSCSPQIRMDILENNNLSIFTSKQKTGEYCGNENYGCYTSSTTTTDIETGKIYCEKITVSPGAALEVGANIVEGTGNAGFIFNILEYEKSCSANVSVPGKVFCIINTTFISQEQVTVCIKRTSGANYKIYYEDTSTCGYVDEDIPANRHDFSIYARPVKFSSPGNLMFNSTEITSSIKNYLEGKYFGDCSAGCYVPVKIYSGINQNLVIDEMVLTYTSGGISKEAKTIYSIDKEPSKITMPFRILWLNSSNLYVPKSKGKYNLTLRLGNSQIAKEQITVESIPVIEDLYPLSFPIGDNILFTVTISGANVSRYKWDFGDNVTLETTSNTVFHKYTAIKSYSLKITAKGEFGETTRTFTVNAYSAKDYINQTLIRYKNKTDFIRSKISSYPVIVKNTLDRKIQLAAIESKIEEYKAAYPSSLNDTAKQLEILEGLSNIKIPVSINYTKIASGDFLISYDSLPTAAFKKLAGYKEGSDEVLKNLIYEWSTNNLNLKAEQFAYFIIYENSTEIINYFNVNVIPNENIDTLYVTIEKIGNIETSITTQDLTTHLGFSMNGLTKGTAKNFDFTVDKNILFLDTPVSFAPPASKLSLLTSLGVCNYNKICEKTLGEDSKNCRNDCKPWGKALLLILLLFIVFLVIYILLQEWYKRRYEDWLFKDKNDLFNIIHFISNAEKQGMSKQDIVLKLKEKGWTSEQIEYAYKKYKGERTGMWEIPIMKIFEKNKLKKEMEARKNQPININIPPIPKNPILQPKIPPKNVQLNQLKKNFSVPPK